MESPIDKKKFTLITGATGGIGSALVHDLINQEKNLILVSRDPQKAKIMLDSFEKKSICSEIIILPLDFSKRRSIKDAINILKKRAVILEGVVLMPNSPHKSSECLPTETFWEEMFALGFINPLYLLKGILPLCFKGSKIVLVSGVSSVQFLPDYATSCVLRTAWLPQIKALAHYLGPKSIHINTLSLGGVMTETFQKGLINRSTEHIPLRSYGDPMDVAYAIHGLLGEMANNITGANILCDGGVNKSY